MFKNARPWRFTKPFDITPDALADQLREKLDDVGPDDRDALISAANANGLKPSSQWYAQLGVWEVSV